MATKKAPLFPGPEADAADPTGGLSIARVFSAEGQHPFDSVAWETRTAAIRNHRGETIFEQKDVEFPASWSPLAVNVVASKYFYGDLAKGNGSPADGKREYSLKQLVHRVTRTISDWGFAQGYFASKDDAERFYDELTWLCVNQYGAFNSPVWFNVGLHHQYGVRDTGGKTISGWNAESGEVARVDPYERPQASACFIIAVDDSIDDIWKLMQESARLFKFGSGVGADWSKLRSSREKLSGGGTPSGPVSFMKVQDATGGTIMSGGKTRRAAIMQTLKSWHPDVLEFVRAKQEEERKAWALIEEGYDGSFNGPAYGSVAFQNVNQSLRVDDAFMAAAEADAEDPLRAVTTGETIEEVNARDVLMQVAEGTWVCGDPGVQYEDTIQRWHTVPNSGPINSSNPCVTGDTLVATEGGLRRIDSMLGETPRVVGLDGRLHRATRVVETGVRPVYRLRTRSGYEVRLTADHRVWTENRGDVPAAELVKGDLVRLTPSPFGPEALDADVAEYAGLMLGDGCVSGGVAQLTMDKALEWAVAEKAASVVNRFERRKGTAAVAVTERATSATVATGLAAVRETLARYVVLDEGSAAKRRPPPRPLHRRRHRRRFRRQEPVRRPRLDQRGAPEAGPGTPPRLRHQEQALPRPPPHRPRAAARRAGGAQGVPRRADAQPPHHAEQPDALRARDRVHAREREGRPAPRPQRPRRRLPRADDGRGREPQARRRGARLRPHRASHEPLRSQRRGRPQLLGVHAPR